MAGRARHGRIRQPAQPASARSRGCSGGRGGTRAGGCAAAAGGTGDLHQRRDRGDQPGDHRQRPKHRKQAAGGFGDRACSRARYRALRRSRLRGVAGGRRGADCARCDDPGRHWPGRGDAGQQRDWHVPADHCAGGARACDGRAGSVRCGAGRGQDRCACQCRSDRDFGAQTLRSEGCRRAVGA